MKKNLFLLFALLCTAAFFTACKDDNKKQYEGLNTTYSGEKLAMNYSGKALSGKEVAFNTADGSKATLTMKGAKTSIPALGTNEFETAGVIPGETSTVLNVDLKGTDGKYTFEGTDEANGRKIVYKGAVEEGKLMLDLNVTMPANDLAGKTWKLAPFESDGADFTSTPFYTAWEAGDKKFNLSILMPGVMVPMPPASLLDMALHIMPLYQGKKGYELLESVLKDVTFKEDGNIVATYSDAANLASPNFVTSPVNIAQYCLKDGKLFLFLNPTAIMQLMPKPAKADMGTMFQAFLPLLSPVITPMLTTGIPLAYTEKDNQVSIYADTVLLKSILDGVLPMLTPDIVKLIIEKIKEDPSFASFATTVQGILEQLPEVYKATTKIELGLNLVKAAAE